MINKFLLQLKETIFLYLFLYGVFDLNIMKDINNILNNIIVEVSQ